MNMSGKSLLLLIRMLLLLVLGIVPALVLLALVLALFMLAALTVHVLVSWYVLIIAICALAVVGLWRAAFHFSEERNLSASVTVMLLCAGVLGAAPFIAPVADQSVDLRVTEDSIIALLMIGPAACSVYFVVEQIALWLRRASNKRLECDACKATRASS